MATRKEDREDADHLTRELQRFFEERITPGVAARATEAVAAVLAEHARLAQEGQSALQSLQSEVARQAREAEAARADDAATLARVHAEVAALNQMIDQMIRAAGKQEANDRKTIAELRKAMQTQTRAASSATAADAIIHGSGDAVSEGDPAETLEPAKPSRVWDRLGPRPWAVGGVSVFAAVIIVAMALVARSVLFPAPARDATGTEVQEVAAATDARDPLADGWDAVSGVPALAELCEGQPCETFDGAWSAADAGGETRILTQAHARLTTVMPQCALVTGPREPAALDGKLREAAICLRVGQPWPLTGDSGRKDMAAAMLSATQVDE